MTDEEAFIASLKVNPSDSLPCLVFADWLDEHDRGEQAEYLRNHANY